MPGIASTSSSAKRCSAFAFRPCTLDIPHSLPASERRSAEIVGSAAERRGTPAQSNRTVGVGRTRLARIGSNASVRNRFGVRNPTRGVPGPPSDGASVFSLGGHHQAYERLPCPLVVIVCHLSDVRLRFYTSQSTSSCHNSLG